MEVFARGWSRDCGATFLVSSELEEGYERGTPEKFSAGGVYVQQKTSGSTEILSGPHDLKLNGQYQIVVRLTKHDLLHLMAEAFGDDPLEKVIGGLAKAVDSSRAMNLVSRRSREPIRRSLSNGKKRILRKFSRPNNEI